VETEVIDYFPKYFKDAYSFAYLGKRRLLPYRPIKNWLEFTPVELTLRRRNRGFEKFIENSIPLTEVQYHSYEEINAEKFSHDIFISGSDQVWNNVCVPFDPVYFLCFNSAQAYKKHSYAASFGFSQIPVKLKEEYRKRLKGWNTYSVRENSGVQILKELIGVEAERSCDPTLLLTADEWKHIEKKQNNRKPYILVYCVNETDSLMKYAQELAQCRQMRVVYLASKMNHEGMMCYASKRYHYPKGVENRGGASPSEWLGLFAKAEYVLTDSFHGTVFSVIYHRKFKVLTVFSKGENRRAQDLLTELGLEDRDLVKGLDNIDQLIEWEYVEKKRQEMKESSIAYLAKMINDKR